MLIVFIVTQIVLCIVNIFIWMKVLDTLSKAQKLVKEIKDRPMYPLVALPNDSVRCTGADGKEYVQYLWSDKRIDF